jgi:hypothetical protein
MMAMAEPTTAPGARKRKQSMLAPILSYLLTYCSSNMLAAYIQMMQAHGIIMLLLIFLYYTTQAHSLQRVQNKSKLFPIRRDGSPLLSSPLSFPRPRPPLPALPCPALPASGFPEARPGFSRHLFMCVLYVCTAPATG